MGGGEKEEREGGGGGGAASSSLSVSPTCWVITVNITCLYFFPAIQKFLLKIAQICYADVAVPVPTKTVLS